MSKNIRKEYFEDLRDKGYLAADADNRSTNELNQPGSHFIRQRQKNAGRKKQQSEADISSLKAGKNNSNQSRTANRPVQSQTGFLSALKKRANLTRTENGAAAYFSSGSYVLDLFACVGAMRNLSDDEIFSRFFRAWVENRDLALKILFYARDVRGGLGERHVFRSLLYYLAKFEAESIRKNISLIPFYGRYDDLLSLLETECEPAVLAYIREELKKDQAALAAGKPVSLLAKWLPSINASAEETRKKALQVARGIGMSNPEYRKTLSALRSAELILENKLRKRDYTFSYSAQPSKAMFKYRRTFRFNDRKRYNAFLKNINSGKAKLHTSGVMPYELVRPILSNRCLNQDEREILNTTWNSLEDFTAGQNALAVVDGSGSMYWTGDPKPAEVALSLGMYFAERNSGLFKNHFITFSMSPRLVEIKGRDFVERVRYCETFNECANTNIQAVFSLILKTAITNNLPQSEMPEMIYIISDMEFDSCAENADITNFEYAKQHYKENGYRLPNIVFWNVQNHRQQSPVEMNEQGVSLISGASPRIFSLAAKNQLDLLDPYKFMMSVIGSERYESIHA